MMGFNSNHKLHINTEINQLGGIFRQDCVGRGQIFTQWLICMNFYLFYAFKERPEYHYSCAFRSMFGIFCKAKKNIKDYRIVRISLLNSYMWWELVHFDFYVFILKFKNKCNNPQPLNQDRTLTSAIIQRNKILKRLL